MLSEHTWTYWHQRRPSKEPLKLQFCVILMGGLFLMMVCSLKGLLVAPLQKQAGTTTGPSSQRQGSTRGLCAAPAPSRGLGLQANSQSLGS